MRTKIVTLLVAMTFILAACGGHVSFLMTIQVLSGNTVLTESGITLKQGTKAEVIADSTFNQLDPATGAVISSLTLTKGQIITAVTDVVFDFVKGTVTGEFEFTLANPTPTAVPSTQAISPTAVLESSLDFVLAHGEHFGDYITNGRDYRELSVMEIYQALLTYGFKDTDVLVIAHSDQVREYQEIHHPSGSYDTGKALIKVGDIPRLKPEKGFMIVSSNVYSSENTGMGYSLETFIP